MQRVLPTLSVFILQKGAFYFATVVAPLIFSVVVLQEGTFHFEGDAYIIRPFTKSAQRLRRSAFPRMLSEGHLIINRGQSYGR